MQSSASTIFRAAALRQYMQRSEKSVYLRLPPSRASILLWLLCGLLPAGGVMLSRFVELPVYASGAGVVIGRTDESDGSTKHLKLLLCLPPEELRRLRPGQRVFVHLPGGGSERMRGTIYALGRQTSPPGLAGPDCGAGSGAGAGESEAAAITIRRFGPWPEHAPPFAGLGSRAEARVETGSRRLTAMIPVLGNLFNDDQR